jgi:hypothetical protein
MLCEHGTCTFLISALRYEVVPDQTVSLTVKTLEVSDSKHSQ